jgi:ribonuclease-3
MSDTEQIINGLRSSSPALWDEAITHPSAGNQNNHRLKFLGNAVLNLCIADLVSEEFEEREGRSLKLSSHLRSVAILNEMGRQLGLAAMIRKGPSHSGKTTDLMVARCLEAIIGAVYKDQGFERTKAMVEALFANHKWADQEDEGRDPITELEELVEELHIKVEHESFERTSDGDNIFYHTILVDENAAVAWDRSKEKAEARASTIMVSMIAKNGDSEGLDPGRV